MALRYYITLPDPARARGEDAALAFTAHGADAFAQQLGEALREDGLFKRWVDAREVDESEDDPEAAEFAGTDPGARVEGRDKSGQVELIVTTALPGNVLRHRLRLLAGTGWQLRDVTGA